MTSRGNEIIATFQLTPELWFRASRLILQRQHRWPPLESAIWWFPVVIFLLGMADHTRWFDEGLLPTLILLNAVVLLGCAVVLLAPFLIRRKFDAVYRRLPERNRQVRWRFSPTCVSAEGGLTHFDGTWEDIHEIIATPDFFLIFRQQKSAAGVVPVTAFADSTVTEDFIFLAKTYAGKYVEVR